MRFVTNAQKKWGTEREKRGHNEGEVNKETSILDVL